MTPARLELVALASLPTVRTGDDLAGLIADSAEREGVELADGDVVAVAQKIVSKAEGRAVDLARVVPSAAAKALADEVDKDPRLLELVLTESAGIARARPGLVIARHRLGLVLASAGIDLSNVEPDEGAGESALLLPVDPDASAARLRQRLCELAGAEVAVVVTDTIGRPFRRGAVGTAIGAAGLPALLDLRGRPDRNGRRLESTEIGLADEIAAAASLVMGQADEGRPVVVVRGLACALAAGPAAPAAALVRPADEDLFR